VAEGSAHMYPRLGPTSEWDTCAAQAIVECAGGSVVQHGGGQPAVAGMPVVYNKEDLLNPFFVVYGKVVAAKKKKQQKEVAFGDEAAPSPWASPLVLGALVAVAAAAFLALK